MRKNIIFLIVLFFAFLNFSIFAQDYNALRKLVRGIANVSLASFEIPRQIIKVTESEGDIVGIFWGPIKGICFFVGRTILGVYEVSSFIFPPYTPLVKPEFLFLKEEE